jgi:two-component system sensor kinase FixL
VRVVDNGAGLPSGCLERLFEPFVTSKPSGLGLGLAISRTIVESHGGKLWASRNPGGGATFCFSIPAQPAA